MGDRALLGSLGYSPILWYKFCPRQAVVVVAVISRPESVGVRCAASAKVRFDQTIVDPRRAAGRRQKTRHGGGEHAQAPPRFHSSLFVTWVRVVGLPRPVVDLAESSDC